MSKGKNLTKLGGKVDRRKRLLCIILSLVFLLSACTTNKDMDTKIENSEKMGKAKISGHNGDISVEVNFKDGKIDNIKSEHKETEGLGSKAIDDLTKKIIDNQNLDIDIISGATVTSNAFISAVKEAVKDAGYKTEDFSKKTEKVTKKEKELTYDLVVIGGGGAGFASAISAKEEGVEKVAIFEKLPNVGGNTLISGAEYAAPANDLQKKEGIKDSPELFAKDVEKAGGNPELIKYLSEHATETAKWLADDVKVEWLDSLMFFGGHSVKRSLIPKGHSGVELINKYHAKSKELGIDVLTEHNVKEILTNDNKVVGVKVETPDSIITVHSKAVIIASGGFGANDKMLYKNDKEIDDKVLSTNSPGATGDGIVMAQKLGADTVDMDKIQLYPICDVETGRLLYVGDTRLVGGALLVNKEGERFVEELATRREISLAIKQQTDNVGYLIWDEKSSELTGTIHSHEAEAKNLYDRGLLVKANTIEELAEHFGVDADKLKATVESFNKNSKENKDPEFNLRMLGWTIEQAPFYMLKAGPAVHHTMGGLKINVNAEVLTKDNEIIQGLYAAGEVTGGIHGTNRLGSVALADISVYGKQAGVQAAKYIKK